MRIPLEVSLLLLLLLILVHHHLPGASDFKARWLAKMA